MYVEELLVTSYLNEKRIRNLQPRPTETKYNWEIVNWELQDSCIAKQLGCAISTVWFKRQQLKPRERKFKYKRLNSPTHRFRLWAQKHKEEIKSLTLMKIIVLFGSKVNYNSVREVLKQEKLEYMLQDKIIFNWKNVDWAKNDASIARDLGCSRERVRQVRRDKNISQSKLYRHYERVKNET